MAKVKYNVKGVESGGNRPLIKPAVYKGKISDITLAQPDGKDPRLEIDVQLVGGEYDKQYLKTNYINVVAETQAWKLRQFLEAVGLVTDKKEAGEFDTAKLKGKEIRVRVRSKMDEEWGPQNEVGTFLPLDSDDEESADDEPTTDDEETTDDADGAEETDEDEGDEELWTEEELAELDDDDLVLYAFGGEDEDGDEVEGLIDPDTKDEFQTKKKKGKKTVTALDRAKLIAAMLEAQDEEGDEDEEDEDTPDYERMDETALRALCKERGLSVKGKKPVLVKRLQKDDEPF